MTLKEKFNEKISYPFSEYREQMKFLKNENNVECEKITEEFTTEFVNWLNNKVITKSGTHHHLLGKLTVEELLPIFKREKGL